MITPNQPMYKRFSVEVTCSQKRWVAITLNCLGRHLENGQNNSEMFYLLGRDCPAMSATFNCACILLLVRCTLTNQVRRTAEYMP